MMKWKRLGRSCAVRTIFAFRGARTEEKHKIRLSGEEVSRMRLEHRTSQIKIRIPDDRIHSIFVAFVY
jgi:hypothetical protein